MANVPPSPSFLNVRCLFRDGGEALISAKVLDFPRLPPPGEQERLFLFRCVFEKEGERGAGKTRYYHSSLPTPSLLGTVGSRENFLDPFLLFIYFAYGTAMPR